MVQRKRLRWYGHLLRKDDDDWVKMCYLEVEGPDKELDPGKLGKRLWIRVSFFSHKTEWCYGS